MARAPLRNEGVGNSMTSSMAAPKAREEDGVRVLLQVFPPPLPVGMGRVRKNVGKQEK